MTEPVFLTDARAFYDTIADEYAERFKAELEGAVLARAMLDAFAELVGPGGRVLEAGSGPGRVTAYLHARGLDIGGVDLSPRMVELARAAHPHVRYEVGSMTALEAADGSLAGLVAFYSLIHIPGERLPDVLAGFRRALAPGGVLLLGFQVGDEPRRHERTAPDGSPVSLAFRRLRPARMAELLAAAGFDVEATMERAAQGDEPSPHAYVIARARR